MRTIKFRVWNKKTNDWVNGCGPSDRPELDGVYLLGETILLGGFLNEVSIQDLNKIVALQYTGNKDSKGREIFEGDIVRTIYTDDCGTGQNLSIGLVEYSDVIAGFRVRCGRVTLPLVTVRVTEENDARTNQLLNIADEILGNVYENPELLISTPDTGEPVC